MYTPVCSSNRSFLSTVFILRSSDQRAAKSGDQAATPISQFHSDHLLSSSHSNRECTWSCFSRCSTEVWTYFLVNSCIDCWTMSSIGTGVSCHDAGLFLILFTAWSNASNTWWQYDLSVAQFSPDGRVFQIEYAAKAVENSGYVYSSPNKKSGDCIIPSPPHIYTHTYNFCRTAIGIRGKDGVVLGVEKLMTSKLHEAGSNKRIFTVDRHVGVVSWARQTSYTNTVKPVYNDHPWHW